MNLQDRITRLAADVESLRLAAEASSAPGKETSGLDANLIEALLGYLALPPAFSDDDLFQKLLRCAMFVTGAQGAGIMLYRPETQMLRIVAAVGMAADELVGKDVPLENSLSGMAFVTGETQAGAPLNNSIEEEVGQDFTTVVVSPLMVEDEAIGTLGAVNKQGGQSFTLSDMEACRYFADLAALLVRQRLREQELAAALEHGTPIQLANDSELHFSETDRLLATIVEDVVTLGRSRPERLTALRDVVHALRSLQ